MLFKKQLQSHLLIIRWINFWKILRKFVSIFSNFLQFVTFFKIQECDLSMQNDALNSWKISALNFRKKKLSLLSYLLRHFHFQQIADINYELQKWRTKIQRKIEWNDSARIEKFDSFVINFKKIIINSIFKKSELKFWRNKKINKLHEKRINRKCLKLKKIKIYKTNCVARSNC